MYLQTINGKIRKYQPCRNWLDIFLKPVFFLENVLKNNIFQFFKNMNEKNGKMFKFSALKNQIFEKLLFFNQT